MKRTDRYFRLMIILIISIVSLSGMALVNSSRPAKKLSNKLVAVSSFQELIQNTLSASFENSFIEVDISKSDFPLNLKVQKGFKIDNKLIDYGRIYHVKINDKFSDRDALRKMLDVLSENYIRIRRESLFEKNSGDLYSTEELGYVYDEYERFTYISKIITQNEDAWFLILTFNEDSRDKVKDLLDSIWIEKVKGGRLS